MTRRKGKRALERNLRRMILVLVAVTGMTFPVRATVFSENRKEVNALAREIRQQIDLGGAPLVKGITVSSKDRKEWEQAEKRLRRGKYGYRYDYVFSRRFSSVVKLTGFMDTVVAKKYRYLEMLDYYWSDKKPYTLVAATTKLNKSHLDYYIKHQKEMIRTLNRLYAKEIGGYKKKPREMKLAIAITVVDNYFEYNGKLKHTNNLAYTIKKKQGVCADYSYMLDYFLRKMGMTCRLVGLWETFSKDGKYAWHKINAVKINGEWFYIDPTNMDRGDYAVIRSGDNLWFSSDLDYLTFPGWKVRSVY